ncbi:hypothetical protein DYB38_013980 [Aphanomyces astaci]|uniref:Aspartate/glutamate/uridylate kinase domain-containing protein n=1 Tax=Aphanomyces astaci TaxID=112090 RepID=A0A397CBR7_APHAT|nr:hypothetical protein DYB38_013980 [Aphanomyces astaci]RHY41786.1 hypothetical protein DYB34_013611 [Aphanomyces astaci]RHZ17145.1 hypothetical protein DYB31_002191 [Aphanomyces astaci]
MDEPRSSLQHARIILVKIGTEVVNSPEGLLAMGKIGSIVEQIARLHMQGKQIILVSSGAVAIGRMVLKRQQMLSGSMQSHLKGYNPAAQGSLNPKACAAAGQSGMQSLYEVLFSQYHLACSQILTSDTDFQVPEQTILSLLQVGIIPIINENDVVSQRKAPLTDAMVKRCHHGQLDKVLACVDAINSGVVKAAVMLPAAPNSLVHAVEGQRIGTLFRGPAPLPRPSAPAAAPVPPASKL